MLSGSLGQASLGQFALGGGVTSSSTPTVIPAPLDRTFLVDEDAAPFVGYKTPSEVKNWSFDWSRELVNDAILTSSFSSSSTDVTVVATAADLVGALTTVLLSGGNIADSYFITNQVITENGLTLSKSFQLFVHQYNN